jgi:hypothetical protein
MATSHLNTGGESTPETSCISNIPRTMDNVQHSVPIIRAYLLFLLLVGRFNEHGETCSIYIMCVCVCVCV